MKIKISGLTVNIIPPSTEIPQNKTPIIFLHGFTGSASDWEFAIQNIDDNYFPIAIDLPGHGETEASDNINDYTIDSINNIISSIIEELQISKVILVGYSMGGRAALSFATKNQEKVLGLILESSTAGIDDKSERAIRVETDRLLSEKIVTDGIGSFVNYWMDLPFFRSLKSLSENEYSKVVQEKKQNSPQGLANSLLGFSTGKMPSLWSHLISFTIPTLLITGILDRKYVRINKEMNKLIPNSKLEIMHGCGHNTHLENRKEFIILVNKFLSNLENHET